MEAGIRVLRPLVALLFVGCSAPVAFRMSDGSDARTYVTARDGGSPGSDPDGLRFKKEICDGEDLRPDGRQLTEADLVQYLSRQQLDIRVERPRADLVYLIVTGGGSQAPVRLRVAILKNADEAGHELHEALLQHGNGAWGVRRSNLAILGPIGSLPDDLTFASKTRLSCWGMFMTAGRGDVYAVPGGYREL